jgi:hypothetical protein
LAIFGGRTPAPIMDAVLHSFCTRLQASFMFGRSGMHAASLLAKGDIDLVRVFLAAGQAGTWPTAKCGWN